MCRLSNITPCILVSGGICGFSSDDLFVCLQNIHVMAKNYHIHDVSEENSRNVQPTLDVTHNSTKKYYGLFVDGF